MSKQRVTNNKPITTKPAPLGPNDDRGIKVTLNEEQSEIVKKCYNDAISVFIGKAGTGKTLTAVRVALSTKFKKGVNKIIITRPQVTKEEMGFLPGDIKEKMDPWLQPIYHNMYQCSTKEKITKMLADGDIEIAPITFLRGRTFIDSIIISDESQNLTVEQMEMLVGRLGKGSKLFVCGDGAQIDLKNKKDSGLNTLINICNGVEGTGIYEFKTNHRHPIIEVLLDKFEKLKEGK